MAKFNKSSFSYFSSWELARPFTPLLAMFLAYFVESWRFHLKRMKEMFSSWLITVPTHFTASGRTGS